MGGGYPPETNAANTYEIQYTQVNPINSNQLAFSEKLVTDTTISNWSLVLYDVESQAKTYLSSIIGMELGYVHYAWDNKNNLYFNVKMGDSCGMSRMNTITGKIEHRLFYGLDFVKGMSWIEATQRIGFQAYGGKVSVYYFMLDFETGDVDTLYEYWHDFYFHYYDVKFSKDLYLNSTNYKQGIMYYNALKPDSGVIANKWQLNSGRQDYNINEFSCAWHPHKNVLYMANPYTGIHYSSVHKQNVVRIRKYCDNLKYHEITISGDGKYIFALRTNYEYSSQSPVAAYDGWLYRRDEIVRMDIDGCNEKVIYKGY